MSEMKLLLDKATEGAKGQVYGKLCGEMTRQELLGAIAFIGEHASMFPYGNSNPCKNPLTEHEARALVELKCAISSDRCGLAMEWLNTLVAYLTNTREPWEVVSKAL